MKARWWGSALTGDEAAPFRDLFEGAEHRTKLVAGVEVRRARIETVENVDRGVGKPRARRLAFLGGGDEECPAAGRPQGGEAFIRAEAVAVRFHRRAAFGIAAQPRVERLPVGGERVEVDGDASAVAGRGGIVHCVIGVGEGSFGQVRPGPSRVFERRRASVSALAAAVMDRLRVGERRACGLFRRTCTAFARAPACRSSVRGLHAPR
jgi:hypothetical protein